VAYYHRTFKGLVAHQDYRVVNAWEIEATEVLEREVLALIPYVPLMKGAGEAEIRDSARLLRQRGMGEEMEVVLALFASFVMEPEQIQRIMRWNMSVLKESPWYQEILQEGQQLGWLKGMQKGLEEGRQEGLQKGRQEGLEEGLQEGRQEGLQTGILRLFKVRFDPSPEIVRQVEQQMQKVTDLADLENLLVHTAQVQSVEAFLAEIVRIAGAE
jgi:predicted transposase YdaD